MDRRLLSFLSLFLILALLSAFAPAQVRPFAPPTQRISPATPFTNQEGPAGAELSLTQALPSAPEIETTTPAQSALGVELVGQIGGETKAVAIQDSYAYLGVGHSLTILDVSNPSSPLAVGRTEFLGGLVVGVAVSDSYAYVADHSGLRVINVSNPANPYEVGFYDSPGFAVGVAVAGSYAYVADWTSGLRVINVSTPSNPYEVGFYDPGSAVDVAIAGSYAYVADGDSGLRVVDVSTPSSPYQVGIYDTPGKASGVTVAGGYAYVADGDQGLRVVDISNPSHPWEAGSWVISWPHQYASDVAVSGSYAYIPYWSGGLRVVNVSSPSNPYEVGSCCANLPGGSAVGVAVAGSYTFVAYGSRGLRIANVTTPSNPYLVGSYELPGWTHEAAIAGDYAYVADGYRGLAIVDVSTPSKPTLVGTCDLEGYAWDVGLAGDYAYVADGSSGLRAINVSLPSNPYETGFYDTPGYAYGVEPSGHAAFVADDTAGLRALSIWSPSNMYESDFYDTPGNARGVARSYGYVYVADGSSGLRVIDAHRIPPLVEVGFYDTPGDAQGVAVTEGYAYVADGSSGLRVVDVSTPASPVEVGFYDTPGYARDVAVAGSYAYVADGPSGLRVVDVSTPASPVEVGFYDTPYDGWGVAVAGDLVYVSDGRGGLLIVRVSPLALALASFIAESGEQITTISDASVDIAEVGDYFLDKVGIDGTQLVVNLMLSTIDLLNVDWGQVKLGVSHILTPGYKASLYANWSGWMDVRVAKHWYKPLYDAIHNDRELLFRETAWSGVKYYAREAGIEAAADRIKEWLLAAFVPGPGTPLADLCGNPAQKLGEGYRNALQREQDELLADLPGLGHTPEEEQAYIADLLARKEAQAQIVAQAKTHRDLLWDNYQDALADEGKWWKFWGPLLVKWAVIGAATLTWDGPGYVVASATLGGVATLYDLMKDTRAIGHDLKMLDQSLRFLKGRVSSSYVQMGLNTVNAMNLIRAGNVPQIAAGDLGEVAQKSFGHYRLWPSLWWAEESSQVELPISNTTDFAVTYLTSASYTHTGFWAGAARLAPEGESPELTAGSGHTAVIRFKAEEDGASPDDGSTVDLLILGASETGLYPVASAEVLWSPTRIHWLSGALARPPAGLTDVEAESAPTLPYPLSTVVRSLPGSTDHTVSIAVENPFDLSVSATVTQTVPGEFSFVDVGGAELVGDALVWTDVLSPHVGLEMRAVLRWEAEPGDSTVLPGPTLAFEDPNTGQGDTYTTADEEVLAPWPLEVTAAFPVEWMQEVETPISVTLSNVSFAVTADGELNITIRTPAGVELWSTAVPVYVEAGHSPVVTVEAEIATTEKYAVVSGDVTLGSVRRRVFQEIVSVEGHQVYLPLVVRSY